jgi:hypothetical protein
VRWMKRCCLAAGRRTAGRARTAGCALAQPAGAPGPDPSAQETDILSSMRVTTTRQQEIAAHPNCRVRMWLIWSGVMVRDSSISVRGGPRGRSAQLSTRPRICRTGPGVSATGRSSQCWRPQRFHFVASNHVKPPREPLSRVLVKLYPVYHHHQELQGATKSPDGRGETPASIVQGSMAWRRFVSIEAKQDGLLVFLGTHRIHGVSNVRMHARAARAVTGERTWQLVPTLRRILCWNFRACTEPASRGA